MLKALIVEPGSAAGLSKRDTDDRLGLASKDEAKKQLAELVEEISPLHDRLYAESARSVLLVVQGLDASGKDGTIRSVFTGLNPAGCRVVSFKAPTGTSSRTTTSGASTPSARNAARSRSSTARTTRTS